MGDWVRFWSNYDATAVALMDDHQLVRWGELESRVRRLSMGLEMLGIKMGDRVAALTLNRVEHFEVFFACARLGAIFVPLNPMLTAFEISRICEDAGVRFVISEESLQHLVSSISQRLSDASVILIDRDHGKWWSDLHSQGELVTDDRASGDDPLILCYTSGTTGGPKGAILSHRNIEAMASGAIAFDGLNRTDCAVVPVPLAFVGAGVAMALPVLKAGGSVLIRQEFDAGVMLADIERHSISTIGVVPVILDRMSREPGFETADLSSWRAAKCGGSVPAVSLLELYQSRGVRLSSAYGLTEAGAFNLLLPPQDAIRKRGSIGMPILGQQARVVDSNGDDVQPGTRGELVLRGECVFLGYWNNEEATNEALRDGWLHTGDIVVKDEEGYFWIVDRAKDIIISGGNNIYSAEVEAVLLQHPDIVEVAVVGMPDPKWGETPVAWVVALNVTLTLEELNEFAKERLARYKRPTKLMIVDALPRGATGKILKRTLREALVDGDAWKGQGA